MMERLLGWFVDRLIAGPDEESLASLIVTARRTFENKVLGTIASFLSSEHRRRFDASLADEDSAASFSGLKAAPGQPNLDNILIAAKRLAFVRQLTLPGAAFPDLSGPVARMLRRRVLNETAWTMRRHPDGRRHALYAFFLAHREREITDGLVDLLVEVVHKVGSQAKKRVLKAFTDEIERVQGGPVATEPKVRFSPRRRCFVGHAMA